MMRVEETLLTLMFFSTALFSGLMTTYTTQPLTVPQIEQQTSEEIEKSVVLYENVTLRSACIIGSIMGAFLSVITSPCIGPYAPREMALRFLGSLICGVLFTPALMRASNIYMDYDFIMAVSGIVSFLAVTIIHKALPVLESKVPAGIQELYKRIFGKG